MKQTSVYQFGHDTLGPVANLFVARLHSYLRQCDAGQHRILFAMRAGLRIQQLYETWLSARNLAPPTGTALLKTSRMMAIKAAYATAPTVAATALGRELEGATLNEIIRSLLAQERAMGRCPELPEVDQFPLHEFLGQDGQVARFVRRYLTRQSELYEAYLSRLAGDAKRLILVDSGWRGTTQLLLEAAFPNYEWEGVYFGCIGRAEILGTRPGLMHGMMFDSETYRPERPETAILAHRHLVESLFEPGIPSIEQIEPEDIGEHLSQAELLRHETRENWDDAYAGAHSYVAAHAADPLSRIVIDGHASTERLAEVMCYPGRDDVIYACGKMRSHDLGRPGEVAPVMPPKDRFDGDSADLRIEEAIWPAGQMAVEYGTDRARACQKRHLSRLQGTLAGSYFVAATDASPTENPTRGGHVAILTRTKDRPLLLRRAAESVAAQTHEDYTWVVVNDGGNLEDVQEVIRRSAVDPSKITICSNARSLGMEAASNVGIRSTPSDYVVIHDDDDSWHPDFLRETVRFLVENHQVYGGVITKTRYVSEEIRGQMVIEHGRWPYNDWVGNVQLSEMVMGNIFPPIAFLFRRDIWEDLGGFDERLPVLGDWDFNIRFLMKADIGVLPKALANYHHRDREASTSTYSNSVIGGISRHMAYNAIVRNKYLRLATANPEYATLAVLMGTAFAQIDTRNRLENAKRQIISARGNNSNDHDRREAEQLRSQLVEAQDRAQALQVELDRRWIMLHMAASELVGSGRKWSKESVSDRLAHLRSSLDAYMDKAGIDAPPDFDEDAYLKQNMDVADALAEGRSFGAFDHYIKYGRSEGRPRCGALPLPTGG